MEIKEANQRGQGANHYICTDTDAAISEYGLPTPREYGETSSISYGGLRWTGEWYLHLEN